MTLLFSTVSSARCRIAPLLVNARYVLSGVGTSAAQPSNNLPQLRLVDQARRHAKASAVFRYDPPVLLVGATWHEKKLPFVELLGNFLKVSYYGHEDMVGV